MSGISDTSGLLVASGDAANAKTSSIYSTTIPGIVRKRSWRACSSGPTVIGGGGTPPHSLLLLLLYSTNSLPYSLSQ